jgi:tetratricopeptide (TPR) repeat protein
MSEAAINSPKLTTLKTPLLQLAAAGLAMLLYALGIVALKWWVYPGWTWRGYLTELKAVAALVIFALGFGFWLFELYRARKLTEAAPLALRSQLRSDRLPLTVAVLLVIALSLAVALALIGERPVARELMFLSEQSNWKHARSYLQILDREPLRPELTDTFKLFVDVHELSERDQLKGSRSLREDRQRAVELLDEGDDYYLFNSLSYAELSKAIYFIEDADERKTVLAEAIDRLNRRLIVLPDRLDQARLLARVGELNLAERDYSSARSVFERALALETRPTLTARLRANLGNVHAANGDLQRAVQLYTEAEANYPEGRRAIYYSNFGYLLMLAKNYAEAKQKVERAIQIEPTDWYSYLNLALIKERLGDYDDAYEDFKVVIGKSENPDSRREARILAGRCLELAGRPASEYLALYLEADGRSTALTQLARVQNSPQERAALYAKMATHLKNTNTHAIEAYIEWFRQQSLQNH